MLIRNKTIQYTLFTLYLAFLYACNVSTNSNQSNINSNTILNKTGLSETKLFLNAQFSECGEWGGHKEHMVIYTKTDNELYLNYQKYKVNCDSIGVYYGTSKFQQLEIEKNIRLNDNNKKSILDYIQRMIKSKLEERYSGRAENSFSVINSDSTLFIHLRDNIGYDVISYNTLLDELKLTVITRQKKN